MAPRGLITILLFYSIPENLVVEEFNTGILLLVILVSSIVMSIALIRYKHRAKLEVGLEAHEVELELTETPPEELIQDRPEELLSDSPNKPDSE